MQIKSSGPETIGCTKNDLRKYKTKMEEEERDFNAENLVVFFSFKREKNDSFFFHFELDATNRLVRCF